MKKVFCVAAVLVLGMVGSAAAQNADDDAIRAVVDSAYVQGVHNESDPAKIRAGMHESFVMFVLDEKGVRHLTRDAWIERIEASKAKAPNTTRPKTDAAIEILDRSGNAAVVKVDLSREGKHIFTDYISLYRTADGWKLVGKIFQRH